MPKLGKWLHDMSLLVRNEYSHTAALVTVGVSLVAFFGTTDFAKELLRSFIDKDAPPPTAGGNLMLGVPSWMWGLIAFLACLFIWMSQAALRLKRALMPAIDLKFRPEAEGIVQSRVNIVHPLTGATIESYKATFVRVTLICLSEVPVPWPLRIENILDDEATYRFTITVIGDGIAKDICVPIVWTKRWDAITSGPTSS